ncbi:MAG TPA: 30S ribosomal protein S16 [bacterium]|jgi:small subunit ribosomal protein S16|nr:30S ribosomal protein S16 [Dictyoglomota bacterium]HHV81452.1 30S ribosomal protein S16 [bacterium]HOK29093.1 30S ribosomal protein S16 [bacterium]HOL54333.1 30S ribosomal protein S16 [bacterium]HON72811.1 30S ribosomal protein S16 [bacterium]
MVKIRLRRMGKRGRPSYRIIVADIHSPRDGKFIDTIGYYDPIPDPVIINIDLEKAKDWIQKGAQPTDTVKYLLIKAGLDFNALKG